MIGARWFHNRMIKFFFGQKHFVEMNLLTQPRWLTIDKKYMSGLRFKILVRPTLQIHGVVANSQVMSRQEVNTQSHSSAERFIFARLVHHVTPLD